MCYLSKVQARVCYRAYRTTQWHKTIIYKMLGVSKVDNKQPRGVGRADHKQPGKDTSLHWAAKLPSLHSLDTSTVTCGCAQHLHECWWHQWSWLPVQAADNMLAVCRLQLPLRRILGTLGAAVGCCSSQAVQPGFIQARMGLLHQVAGHMQCSAVRDPSKQQCRQCTSRGGCSSTRQSRASASGSIAPESGGCLEAAQEQGGKAIQPTAPEDGLPGVHFRTASVTSGGEGTLRCFEPSQGCSDSPDTPAQHDIVWLVGCFMSGHAYMQGLSEANNGAAAFKAQGQQRCCPRERDVCPSQTSCGSILHCAVAVMQSTHLGSGCHLQPHQCQQPCHPGLLPQQRG